MSIPGRLSGRASRLLALLYLLVALPISVSFSFATTMLDVPDEANHLMRATQVGQGGFVATRYPGNLVGGELPFSALQAANFVNVYLFHPGRPIDPRKSGPFEALRWPSPPLRGNFPNTAIYPPWFYAASAVAIDAGRVLHLRVMASFRLARLANAVTSTLIAAAAIGLSETGAPILAVLLALPMTLSLFGSGSQDSVMIACAALAAALLTRQMAGRDLSWRGWMLSGLLLGLIGGARAPYAILSLLPAVIAWPRPDRARGLAATALALVAALLWLAGNVIPLSIPTAAGGGLLSGAQMHWVVGHPFQAWATLVRSPVAEWTDLSQEFMGRLGWLDIRLPPATYVACGWTLIATLLFALAWSRLPRPRELVMAALLLAVALAIEAAIYLSWDSLGAPFVIGVQGRYFIPLTMFLCLLGRRSGATMLAAGVAALLVIVSAGDLVALHAVAARYPG